MKAMRLSEGRLQLVDLPPALLRPGEVRVRVHGASVNFRDGLVIGGIFPSPSGLIPLSDGAGEVVEVGEGAGAGGLAVGDRVISTFHPNWRDGHVDRAELNNSPGGPADGFACEEVVRPAWHFTRAPENLSLVEAASLPCAAVTAWRAVVTDGHVSPGEHVLVQGTGGVSLFALQFAKAAGAVVVAIGSTPEKRQRLLELGADHVIDRLATPEWGDAVLDLTRGLGVEHVIEVGGPNTLAQSFRAARTGAHVAIIGAVAGFDRDTMPFAVVQAKRLCLQAVTVGSRRDQIEMVRAIEAHDLHPAIDRVFPLVRLEDAIAHMQSGQQIGKICIEM
ncbi:NAD(P)-dependent alcohol dehydrogenase [Novosphingobium sp. BL-8H]|uniref:zinc-dependent alcohol dehydrogenase family protein n=1 Tax=Novosphingobium sp. BL-8H TaxID=3127640 RepID=UPI0037569AFE